MFNKTKKKRFTIEVALILAPQTEGKGIHMRTVVAVVAQPSQSI